MAAGPCQFGSPGRRKRNRNTGRGPGNLAGLARVGRKVVPRAKRMAGKRRGKR